MQWYEEQERNKYRKLLLKQIDLLAIINAECGNPEAISKNVLTMLKIFDVIFRPGKN